MQAFLRDKADVIGGTIKEFYFRTRRFILVFTKHLTSTLQHKLCLIPINVGVNRSEVLSYSGDLVRTAKETSNLRYKVA